MSWNAPPAVFVIGVMLMPVALMVTVMLLPSPVDWPVGIGVAVVIGTVTRRLTTMQLRREFDEHGAASDADG
jgi:uncharacterized membrane-anchored protein YhcB (DUF1043 family)